MKKFTEEQLMIFEKEQINCEDVAELLGDYQDHELPPSLRGRIDLHLRQCPQCFEMERSYRMVVELARELKETMPAGVSQRLKEALNRRLGLHLRVS